MHNAQRYERNRRADRYGRQRIELDAPHAFGTSFKAAAGWRLADVLIGLLAGILRLLAALGLIALCTLAVLWFNKHGATLLHWLKANL